MNRRFFKSGWGGLFLFLAICLTGVLFFGKIRGQNAPTNSFDTGPVPAWVKLTDEPQPDVGSSYSAVHGEYYLLLEQQDNAATEQSFWRVVKKITDQNGVQNGATLQFHFNPAFQQLTIHFIHVIRDGKVIDKLDRDKFRTIQQETGLERHMFDGSLSAVLFLEDIRVGDIIEYAATTQGANPIMKGRFVDSFLLEWTAPVHTQYCRLLWPPNRKLTIKNHKTSTQPSVSQTDGMTEYVWETHDVAAATIEDSVPAWYEAFGWVQLTEFSSWEDVVNWALPLYDQGSSELPEDLSRKISQWKVARNQDDWVRLALRFVQDEVRYMGIEVGRNSHQPNGPSVVFARRFGDCKDKVNLFCAILRQMGIEAHPVLVNSYRCQGVDNWAPSPWAFNHVVAQVKLDGRMIWLDPTFSYQRGELKDIYFPDYERGLVIAEGNKELSKIPVKKLSGPTTTIDTSFQIFSYSNSVAYNVTTIKRGGDADLLRALLARTTLADLEKEELNRHAKAYPKIKTAVPMEIKDDQEKNIIRVTEDYYLSDIWELSSDKVKWTLGFYPDGVYDLGGKPDTSFRTQPLWVPTRHQKQIIHVRLPEDCKIKDESETIQDLAVRFKREAIYTNRNLTLNYECDTFTNAVGVESVAEYLNALRRIRDVAAYSLQRPNGAVKKPSAPNWMMFMLAGMQLVLMTVAAALIYRLRPAIPPSLAIHSELTGLGGWLVLLAIGLFIRPLSLLGVLVKSTATFSLSSWEMLTTPGASAYSPHWAPLLIVELLGNLMFLVFAVLLLILFFQKRSIFPSIFVAYVIALAIFVCIDHFWALAIPLPKRINPAKPLAFLQPCFYALIWSLYMAKSRRVKATFVN